MKALYITPALEPVDIPLQVGPGCGDPEYGEIAKVGKRRHTMKHEDRSSMMTYCNKCGCWPVFEVKFSNGRNGDICLMCHAFMGWSDELGEDLR